MEEINQRVLLGFHSGEDGQEESREKCHRLQVQQPESRQNGIREQQGARQISRRRTAAGMITSSKTR